MDKDPSVGAPKDVGYCAAGKSVKVIYADGFESKSGWSFQRGWQLSSEGGYPYAAFGHDAADGWPTAGDDITLTQRSGVRLAPGAHLRFDHAYWLQPNDGARVEYNTGSGWKVASTLPNVNGEDTPAGEFDGQKSFGGESNGFGGTRYDLSSLAGKTVKLRFHLKKVGGDPETAEESSWYVDNLKIYTCV
ncbi:hypothetical protein ABZV93_22400 [Actinopolymorpha sp. NPDC004070]|uniref:hypothetical protein n=1 Tax=Actinopolymorpha sp. NPDC004070 TaxID=3154548 RepID=UPI0033B057A3